MKNPGCVPARRQKIESRKKLKMSAQFQRFCGKCKTTRADRNLRAKTQIVSRRLGAPPEIRNCRGTIEKFRGKINSDAENLQHPRRIQIAGSRANVSGEDLNFRAQT
jgi:hypothetical protein